MWIPISKTNTENHLGPENIKVVFTAVLISGHIGFSDGGVVQFTGLIPHCRIQWITRR